MKKANKNFPVWLKIENDTVYKATLMGIEQRMIELGVKTARVLTFQKVEGRLVEVSHVLSGTTVQA